MITTIYRKTRFLNENEQITFCVQIEKIFYFFIFFRKTGKKEIFEDKHLKNTTKLRTAFFLKSANNEPQSKKAIRKWC